MDFIHEMLEQAEKTSTNIDDVDTSNIEFVQDEKGVLWSVDKRTGKKVGRIYEHGVDKGNMAKSFNDFLEERR